jgi:dipeptidyl aminopeptidase/acylaminoacyl peptidase
MVGQAHKDIDPRQMATLDLHRIKARDGLDLPVWITTPKVPSTSPRPAVVLVHGGPWIRGSHWQWEPTAQFLASRGYLVIEPEFRGSSGFGDKHFKAGWKQWGLSMQDDVADGLLWAVSKGWVDPKRVCIAGASYGGYATLMGLVRHPELYRCGVAWAAVTDPRLLYELDWISDLPEEYKNFGLPAMLGDPVKDAAALKAVAPVEQAARIKAPLLLAFGLLDRRVPIEHGRHMRDALHEAGRDVEWVTYATEGHGWLILENRVDFAKRLEAFLARNLK